MKHTRKQQRIVSAQGHLMALTRAVRELHLPSLGPQFAELTGTELADALVAHRLLKNLPQRTVDKAERRRRTIQDTLDYDTNGLDEFDWRALPQPLRGQYLKTKSALSEFFRGLKLTHAARFPSGETECPSQGHTDLLFKLESDEQWRVSLEAAPFVATICYKNPQLRRVVKARFRATHVAWKFYADTWFAESGNRFYVFKRMFLSVCNIQNYSRLSTVMKNAEKDRPISMEPFWNMVGQLSFARDVRALVYERYGINLNTLADLHRAKVRCAEIATIDFKNASNSNWLVVLRDLLPRNVMKLLLDLRTPITHYNGRFHWWNMLAPMGNGFTFEIMTVVLLHLARVFDPNATVFGDDVMIAQGVAPQFVKLCEALGWVVNTDKSFITGNFRESCGAFSEIASQRLLHSFDFHEITDEVGICVTANKLRSIACAGQVSPAMFKLLVASWIDIVKTLPHVVWRSDQFYERTLTRKHFGGHRCDLPEGVAIVPHFMFEAVKRSPMVLEGEYGKMYHREVLILSEYRKTLSDATWLPICPKIRLLRYLKNGAAMPTIRGSDKVTIRQVIYPGNAAPSECPLLSFI